MHTCKTSPNDSECMACARRWSNQLRGAAESAESFAKHYETSTGKSFEAAIGGANNYRSWQRAVQKQREMADAAMAREDQMDSERENYREQIDRLRLMAENADGDWDLSENDRAAIRAVLVAAESAKQLREALEIMLAEWEATQADNPLDILEHCITRLRAALAASTGQETP